MDDVNNGKGGKGAPEKLSQTGEQPKPLPPDFLTRRAVDLNGQFSVTPNFTGAVTTTFNSVPVITTPTLVKPLNTKDPSLETIPKGDLEDLKMRVETLTSYTELLKRTGKLREEFVRLDQIAQNFSGGFDEADREAIAKKSIETKELLRENDDHPTNESLNALAIKIEGLRSLIEQYDLDSDQTLADTEVTKNKKLDDPIASDAAPIDTPKDSDDIERESKELRKQTLAELHAGFEEIKKKASDLYIYLSDEDAGLLHTKFEDLKVLLDTSEEDPTFESLQEIKRQLDDISSEHFGGDGDEPTQLSSKQTLETLSFTSEEIGSTRPGNLFGDGTKGKRKKWRIESIGGKMLDKPQTLSSDQVASWKRCQGVLSEYGKYISSLAAIEPIHSELIQAKIAVIRAVENGELDTLDALTDALQKELNRTAPKGLTDLFKLFADPADPSAPKNPEPKLESKIEKRDTQDIAPANITFDNEKQNWMIKHPNGKTEILRRETGLHDWWTTLGALKDYRTFIMSIQPDEQENHQPLVTLKNELVDAIEREDWGVATKKQTELEKSLLELKKNPSNPPSKEEKPTPVKNEAAPSRARDERDIRPSNIWFDKTKSVWKIQHPNNSVETLSTENGLEAWQTTQSLLEDYRIYIIGVDPTLPENKNLITLKDELLAAIEREDWKTEEKKHQELEIALRQITKNEAEAPILSPTSTRKVPLDADDAARSWGNYLADQRSEEESDDFIKRKMIKKLTRQGLLSSNRPIPQQPTAASGSPSLAATSGPSTPPSSPAPSGAGAPPAGPPVPPPGATPATPEPHEPRLIIRMGWPSDIQFFSSKERNGWHELENGNWRRLPTNTIGLWDAVSETFGGPTSRHAGGETLYSKYLKFFESGSYADKTKKREDYGKAIETENKIIQSLRVRKPEEALSYCDMLEEELSEYIEDWNTRKPKAVEQEKAAAEKDKEKEMLRKKFEEQKGEVIKLKWRADALRRELTSDLEKAHIQRDEDELTVRFQNAEVSLNSDSFNKDYIAFAYEGLNQFENTLKGYEERLDKKSKQSGNPRPTVLRDDPIRGNRSNVVKRLGKPDISVDEWTREQEREDSKKNLKEEKDENTHIEVLKKKHDEEFVTDPIAYYKKYILGNKRGILEATERVVIDETIATGRANNFITKEEIEALEKNDALGKKYANASTQTSASTQSYSPAYEANDKAAQNMMAKEVKARAKMSDREIEDIAKADRPNSPTGVGGTRPPQSNGMVRGANVAEGAPTGAQLNGEQERVPPVPSQEAEKKRHSVKAVFEKLQSLNTKGWVGILGGMIATGVVGFSAASYGLKAGEKAGEEKYKAQVTAEATAAANKLRAEADARISPESWYGYIQTPEAKEMKTDLYTMTNESIIKKYFSSRVTSSNPESIAQALSYDASAIIYSHDDNLYGLTEVQRKELSKFLILVQQISQATYAVMQSSQTMGAAGMLKGSYILPVYGDNTPENVQNDYGDITPMTVNAFINKTKTRMHERDKQEEEAKKLTAVNQSKL